MPRWRGPIALFASGGVRLVQAGGTADELSEDEVVQFAAEAGSETLAVEVRLTPAMATALETATEAKFGEAFYRIVGKAQRGRKKTRLILGRLK